jgi:uncharacterized LabA/DUF88 family protein
MPVEPATKRAYVFIDGQNLYHAAMDAFGYTYPNYDPGALARELCASQGWSAGAVYFYTGIPDASDNPFWNHFWVSKLAVMGTRGIKAYSRPLRYRNEIIRLADGSQHTVLVAREKGIDVRIALDVVSLARLQAFDVALLLSQDQDLSEVADEIREIARMQGRWIKIASAYPSSPVRKNRRGINHTDWIPIERKLYDSCLDPNDYRPKRP